MRNTKLVQVRLTDSVYRGLEKFASDEGVTIAELLRKSIQLYAIAKNYGKEGKTLIYEDPKDGSKVQLLIPGITTNPLQEISDQEPAFSRTK